MRILVVGAGPVGLMFCAKLSSYGHQCVLIEKNPIHHTLSRASSLQPASLECLAGFGFLPRLMAHGQRIDALMSWDLDHGQKQSCSYELIRDLTLYPFRLHVNQSFLRDELIHYLRSSSSCTILDQTLVASVVFQFSLELAFNLGYLNQ